jgi:hypothetical protein
MSQTMIVMSAALGAEIVLLLIVALSVAYLRNRAARRRDHAAIQALIARVRQERPQREQAIGQFLGTGLGYQDANLSENTTRLARAELHLLQRFAMLYRDRDADLAGRFDGDLNAMLDAYHALAASTVAGSAADAATPAVDDAELEALRLENKRLSEELRITMETMSRMLNEYSTMFAPVAEPEGLEPMATAIPESPEPMGAVSDVAAGVTAAGDWEVAADATGPGEVAEDGDWEVAVDATGLGEMAEDGDWEVAVEVSAEADGATFADQVEVREPEPEAEDPLAEIMRAAANQEKSARSGIDARGGGSAVPTPAPSKTREAADQAGEEDVDLFDVVVEGTATKVQADSESTARAQEEPGDDLFDLVEAPRSRSAS